jgi:hypothetical protein
MYSGVFYKKENLLKSTVALIKMPIGIWILTGKPFYVMTSFKLLFLRNSFIFVMLAFPPIERVFNTVKKLERFGEEIHLITTVNFLLFFFHLLLFLLLNQFIKYFIQNTHHSSSPNSCEVFFAIEFKL